MVGADVSGLVPATATDAMLIYWVMFLVPAGAAIAQPRIWSAPRLGLAWIVAWLALTLLIGYRFQVGGDWVNYVNHFYMAGSRSLAEVLTASDPGYVLFNWVAWHLGLGIYGVNMACGALFSIGLIVFCRQQPRPWLAMAVAIPYLVIVVAMGYSRQGVAIGLAMLALAALAQKNNLRFVAWLTLATLFHKSAFILMPLAIVVTQRGRWWTAAWISATTILTYTLLVENHTDALVQNYLVAEYASEGAAIRIAMNALPAAVYMAFRRRLARDEHLRRLWDWIAVVSLFTVVLLLVSPSSTAVDRMALYLIPIQIFVFARLPDLGGRDRGLTDLLLFAILGFYGLVMAVWLNFATHANAWLPYRFYLLESS
jgi:hypothetical protein